MSGATIPAVVPADLTRSRRPEKAAAWLVCALLHVAFTWLLNQSPTRRSVDPPAAAPAPVAFATVWLAIPSPGAGLGRALGEPRAARVSHLPRVPPAIPSHRGRDPGGEPGGADRPATPGAGATAPIVGGDVAAGAAVLAPAPTAPANLAGLGVDWEAAKERVAREIAGRYSNADADGDAAGAGGRAISGLVADGSAGSGRPDCGKIYSGAAILGTGLWQYDGGGVRGCEWRR